MKNFESYFIIILSVWTFVQRSLYLCLLISTQMLPAWWKWINQLQKICRISGKTENRFDNHCDALSYKIQHSFQFGAAQAGVHPDGVGVGGERLGCFPQMWTLKRCWVKRAGEGLTRTILGIKGSLVEKVGNLL